MSVLQNSTQKDREENESWWVWWYIPVIGAHEAELGRSLVLNRQEQHRKLCLKKSRKVGIFFFFFDRVSLALGGQELTDPPVS